MIRMRFAVMASMLALYGGAGHAQSRETDSTIRIERSVGVTTMARMAFAADTRDTPRPGEASVAGTSQTTASAPAVIQITGDPGRIYRINLPASLGMPMTNATISQFHVWSRNAGDISDTLTSHMDQRGQDTLRVTGVLSTVTFEDITAAMPITINYE